MVGIIYILAYLALCNMNDSHKKTTIKLFIQLEIDVNSAIKCSNLQSMQYPFVIFIGKLQLSKIVSWIYMKPVAVGLFPISTSRISIIKQPKSRVQEGDKLSIAPIQLANVQYYLANPSKLKNQFRRFEVLNLDFFCNNSLGLTSAYNNVYILLDQSGKEQKNFPEILQCRFYTLYFLFNLDLLIFLN